jgi:hypothetical protein
MSNSWLFGMGSKVISRTASNAISGVASGSLFVLMEQQIAYTTDCLQKRVRDGCRSLQSTISNLQGGLLVRFQSIFWINLVQRYRLPQEYKMG